MWPCCLIDNHSVDGTSWDLLCDIVESIGLVVSQAGAASIAGHISKHGFYLEFLWPISETITYDACDVIWRTVQVENSDFQGT